MLQFSEDAAQAPSHFLCSLQLHLLPVLLHLLVSILLHCILLSMAESHLEEVLPHQVTPVTLHPELPHLGLPNPHVLHTPPRVDHHLTTDLCPQLPSRFPLLRSAPSTLTGRQVNEDETMAVASMSAPASRGVDARANARRLAWTPLLLD
jgi:hypothetical protein